MTPRPMNPIVFSLLLMMVSILFPIDCYFVFQLVCTQDVICSVEVEDEGLSRTGLFFDDVAYEFSFLQMEKKPLKRYPRI